MLLTAVGHSLTHKQNHVLSQALLLCNNWFDFSWQDLADKHNCVKTIKCQIETSSELYNDKSKLHLSYRPTLSVHKEANSLTFPFHLNTLDCTLIKSKKVWIEIRTFSYLSLSHWIFVTKYVCSCRSAWYWVTGVYSFKNGNVKSCCLIY